jgi:hypothetical protein
MVHDEAVLNSVQTWFSGFSAAYYSTRFGMESYIDLIGYTRILFLTWKRAFPNADLLSQVYTTLLGFAWAG